MNLVCGREIVVKGNKPASGDVLCCHGAWLPPNLSPVRDGVYGREERMTCVSIGFAF